MCWIWEELAWKNRVLQTENTLSCCLWTGYMRNFNTESNYIHHNLTKGKPWKTRTDTYGFSTFGILGFSMFLWWFVAVWSNCEWFTPQKKCLFPPLTLVLCDSGRDNQLRVKSPPTPKKWMAKYTTNHRLWKSRDAIPQLRASSNNNSIRVDLGGQEACRNCSDPEIPYCGWTSHPLKQVPSGNLT